MTKVDSSMIFQIGYDEDKTLTVYFTNGRVYRFKDVPAEVLKEFLAAESKGKFFNSNIKWQYFAERVN